MKGRVYMDTALGSLDQVQVCDPLNSLLNCNANKTHPVYNA